MSRRQWSSRAVATALALALAAAAAGCEGTETGNPDLSTGGVGGRPPLGPSLDGGLGPSDGGISPVADAGDPPLGADGGVGEQDAGAGDWDGGGGRSESDDLDAGTP